MNARKLVRGISAVGVINGIAYLIMAFVLVYFDKIFIHAKFMLFGSLILFPYSVAVAYVASVAREPWPMLAPVVVGDVLLYFSPIVAGGGYSVSWVSLLLVLLTGILGIYPPLRVAQSRTGAIRLSLYLVGFTMAGLSASAFAGLLHPSVVFTHALSLMFAFPIPLIYAVTINSLPSTFNDEPRPILSSTSILLSLIASVIIQFGNYKVGLYTGVLSMVAYLVAARFDHLARYLGRVREMKDSPAKSGLMYFVHGHISVVIAVVIVILYGLEVLGKCGTICVIHELALGFVSLHVWIHGPMMVPVILGMKHRRRFNPWPYVFLLAAMFVFPFSTSFALALYLVSFVITILIVI